MKNKAFMKSKVRLHKQGNGWNNLVFLQGKVGQVSKVQRKKKKKE